ncbi:putative fungal pheromoneG-protein-coupled receptor [Paxillus ammoniavirescens]|nr:putative fungal pheromoneG-protein-coupled receptor [Paxillus ammoniavirescens]
MANIPPNALFSALSFIGCILSAIPICWHLHTSNGGICLYLAWTSLGCLILFINSIIWNDNVINWAPVWCDITARYLEGSSIGIPASALCIIRKLFRISRLSSLRPDKHDKRRELWIDLAIGLGFPCLIMTLQYVTQSHRFNIFEQIGCFPATYTTVAALFLILMWPVVIGLISAVLAAFTFRAAYYQKALLDEYLWTTCDISASCYWRLMALCATEICFTVPCGVVAIVLDTMNGQVQPYISWSNVHFDFSQVEQFPIAVWQSILIMAAGSEITRWLYILCAFVSFGFFGLGEEARESYQYALRATAHAGRFLFGWVTRSDVNPRGPRSPSRQMGESSGVAALRMKSPSNHLPTIAFARQSTHSFNSVHSETTAPDDSQVAAFVTRRNRVGLNTTSMDNILTSLSALCSEKLYITLSSTTRRSRTRTETVRLVSDVPGCL